MSGWREGTLSEVAEIIMGQSPIGKTCNSSGVGIPLLNGPTEFGIKFPSPVQFTTDPKRICELNDILFCVRGSTTGRMNWADQKYALGRGLAAIRHKAGNEYQYYVRGIIDHNLPLLLTSATGSTFPNVSRDQIEALEIQIPPRPVQKAIAAVLSSLDDKIDLLHRQNQTLESMAATLFRQWFVEEAQENWEEVAVGDYVELNRASIDKSYPHKTIEYLDTGSLIEGKIENLQLLTLDEAPSRAKRLVQHNDVLISTVRPDQKHYGIIKNPIENLVVSTGFCVFTCTKIDPHFIYLLLTSDEMTDYLHTIAEGSTSTYPSLKPSDIGAIVFQLPPDDRLREFAIIAHNSWEKIEKNHIQIRTLEKLRDTLLPKLMSGEVRVEV
ncbi:MAG: type I restriction enzyme, S subunit [Candidatus Nitrotoga sp. MKT]|nr:MAG: type I restriction enzyme, S subunit [Candidatus Nitrotoga sp. MKT]